MKKCFSFLMAAAAVLLLAACDGESLKNVPDETGNLYGTWMLDTKTVDVVTVSNGKTETDRSETDFTGDNFLLHLTNLMVAFGQEGTLLTFDIDDVDGVKYYFNADDKQISFAKMIYLSKGFLPAKVMKLYGKFDVLELTATKLVLKQVENVELNGYKSTTTTVYSYHKLAAE